ncbi:MAG: flippase activity-associated protein Agl23 [Halobacteriota archaeon]
MSTDGRVPPRLASVDHTLWAVVVVSALALVTRLVGLGTRIFHWDEGRVGYWALRYAETGEFAYRPIIHGPFIPVVNEYVFGVLPPTDFSARLVVAVVGGLLPLTAWLFRDRLRDSEVVALALFLAANPLLVYYSRFMRSDVLVAAFSFLALGLVVRGLDARRPEYFYAAAAAFGLAFTTKENALVYVLCYLGAGALVLDHHLVRIAAGDRSVRDVLVREWPATAVDRLREWGGDLVGGLGRLAVHTVAVAAVFLAVIVFFYAPRPDLWHAFASPDLLPGVVSDATLGSAEKLGDSWLSGDHQSHDYLPYLHDFAETLLYGATVLVAFAAVGVVVDALEGQFGPRALVAFAAYWGLASVVGYPVATDIQAPWIVVHAVIPFAIPAAVGLAAVGRAGLRSFITGDTVSTGLAVLVVLTATFGVVSANATYWNADSQEEEEVLQWAQPTTELKETLEVVDAVAASNDGTDVRFYGIYDPNANGKVYNFYVDDENGTRSAPPPTGWHSRLPLPWYLERSGASIESTHPDTAPEEAMTDAPPVVVAYGWNESELEPHLPGYTAHRHAFKLWGEDVVVFVEDDAANAAMSDRRDST